MSGSAGGCCFTGRAFLFSQKEASMTGSIKLTVRDLLARQGRRGLFHATAQQSVQQVAQQMQEYGISAIAITQEEGDGMRLLGIVSEKDISRLIARSGNPEATTAGEIMSTELVTADVESSLWETARNMLNSNIRHIPVLQDGKPISTLSMRDVLGLLVDTLEAENETLRTDLNWMRVVQGQ
jgi:signal-transduction protein with cAMP-binding, CBS, and nucleotidyltransferase domain